MKAIKVTPFDTLKFELLAKGWRVYQEPILRIVDDTWTFRLRRDSLDFSLRVTLSTVDQATKEKRYATHC